jgi:hypothetical protein
MAVLSMTAENMVKCGANLEITPDAKYLAPAVENMVRIAKGNGAHITIHAGKFLPTSLETFAKIGGHNVTIRI